jgi:hypothetical protein
MRFFLWLQQQDVQGGIRLSDGMLAIILGQQPAL